MTRQNVTTDRRWERLMVGKALRIDQQEAAREWLRLATRVRALEAEISKPKRGPETLADVLSEALNSGDGSYRP